MRKLKRKNLIFAVLLLMIFLLVLLFSKGKSSLIGDIDNIPIEGKYNNIAILDKKIFMLNANTLISFNRKGEELFSNSIPLEKGKLVGNYNKAVIFEGKIFYILNDKGKIKESINVDFNITNVEIKDNTIFVTGDKKLNIYDLKGREIGEIKTDEQIATFALSKDKKEVIVTTLKSERDIFISTIYLKNLEEDEEIIQSFINEIIIYSKYMDDKNYLLVSNNQMLYMSGFKIINKRRISDIKGIENIKSYIYLLEGDLLNVYDLEFNLRNTIELEGDFRYLYAANNRLFLLNENTISEFIRGEIKRTKPVDNIKRIINNNNGLYLLTKDLIINVESYLGG